MKDSYAECDINVKWKFEHQEAYAWMEIVQNRTRTSIQSIKEESKIRERDMEREIKKERKIQKHFELENERERERATKQRLETFDKRNDIFGYISWKRLLRYMHISKPMAFKFAPGD